MKKIYFLLCALAITYSSFGQTIANAGMETWRTNTSGTTSTSVYAPTDWYGIDSLVIGVGESLIGNTDWSSELFQSTTIKNSGSSSAKLMTLTEDMFGFFPGIMTNAQPSFNLPVALACSCITGAINYTGGTETNLKITSVSAYIEYFPGIDTTTHLTGVDSGSLTVQAIGTTGADTVVGTGTVNIPATSSFTQITANVIYVDNTIPVNKVRIFFASGGTTGSLDSSTLYVDDVSMIGVSQADTSNAVHTVTLTNDLVKVYPNPATTSIYLDGPKAVGYTCELFSVSGQSMATKVLTGNDVLDVSYLPAGMYFYSISDTNANKVQRGKLTVNR